MGAGRRAGGVQIERQHGRQLHVQGGQLELLLPHGLQLVHRRRAPSCPRWKPVRHALPSSAAACTPTRSCRHALLQAPTGEAESGAAPSPLTLVSTVGAAAAAAAAASGGLDAMAFRRVDLVTSRLGGRRPPSLCHRRSSFHRPAVHATSKSSSGQVIRWPSSLCVGLGSVFRCPSGGPLARPGRTRRSPRAVAVAASLHAEFFGAKVFWRETFLARKRRSAPRPANGERRTANGALQTPIRCSANALT